MKFRDGVDGRDVEGLDVVDDGDYADVRDDNDDFTIQRGGKGTRAAAGSRPKPPKLEPEIVTISDSDEEGDNPRKILILPWFITVEARSAARPRSNGSKGTVMW